MDNRVKMPMKPTKGLTPNFNNASVQDNNTPQYPNQNQGYNPNMNNGYYNQNPNNYPAKKSKSKTTAGLLALFLGDLGIHKFYLGKTVLGIVYLLFCWTYIPGLIAIIEGIIYLTMDQNTFDNKYGNN